jgi:Suppressor of fused protein (SUFU)
MTRLPAPIRYLETITKHIEKHFGTDYFVLHEKESSTVHVDVHVVKPCPARPYFTLLTSGMSDLDMHTPAGLEDLALAEVCLCLPSDWPLSMENFAWRKPKYSWPIKILQQTARYPHWQKTWLFSGHTVGSVEHPEPIDTEVNFTGLMLLDPRTFPEGGDKATTEDGRPLHFLGVIPLLPAEMVFSKIFGSGALEEKLFDAGVTEIIDPQRRSAV